MPISLGTFIDERMAQVEPMTVHSGSPKYKHPLTDETISLQFQKSITELLWKWQNSSESEASLEKKKEEE